MNKQLNSISSVDEELYYVHGDTKYSGRHSLNALFLKSTLSAGQQAGSFMVGEGRVNVE